MLFEEERLAGVLSQRPPLDLGCALTREQLSIDASRCPKLSLRSTLRSPRSAFHALRRDTRRRVIACCRFECVVFEPFVTSISFMAYASRRCESVGQGSVGAVRVFLLFQQQMRDDLDCLSSGLLPRQSYCSVIVRLFREALTYLPHSTDQGRCTRCRTWTCSRLQREERGSGRPWQRRMPRGDREFGCFWPDNVLVVGQWTRYALASASQRTRAAWALAHVLRA